MAEFDPEVEPEFAPTMAASQLSTGAVVPASVVSDEPPDPVAPVRRASPTSRPPRRRAASGRSPASPRSSPCRRAGGPRRPRRERRPRPVRLPPRRRRACAAAVGTRTPPRSTGVGGRPRPAAIRGADPTGEDCEGGFQITGQAGWASQGVRGSPAATCSFVGSVLKAYWDAADPSRESRTVVATGCDPMRGGRGLRRRRLLRHLLGGGCRPVDHLPRRPRRGRDSVLTVSPAGYSTRSARARLRAVRASCSHQRP